MDDIFTGMDPDKRDRIINAAIEEFAAYPYDKASTNSIVKNAGVSKGLLFHYFENKQVLYEKLIGFVIQKLFDAIVNRIDWRESDLIERIRQIALIKMEVSKTYPHMFDFMMKTLTYKRAGNIDDIVELYKGYGFDFQKVNEDVFSRNIDYSKFRDPETIRESVNIVRWSLEKFGEEQLLLLGNDGKLDFAQAVAGLDHYMDILKKTFYA